MDLKTRKRLGGKRLAGGLLLVGTIAVGARAFMPGGAEPPTVNTAPVGRGSLAETVSATGTLQAVTTVQVGTQVSGIVEEIYADFNSLVRKGQVLARLDPSSIQTQIEQARANLARSQADVARLQVGLEDAQRKLTRAEELFARGLLPRTELETAQVSVKSAEAQVRSARAGVTQAQASLDQNLVNLQHTVITAPIDGLVVSRNVDRGQTVASSMSAPTLFVLAADLTKMQVLANIDESDVGRIRPGQTVTFSVDAYQDDHFSGSVLQVRLEPIVQQGVVSYATIIDVPNPAMKLKPGMTANVTVEIARADDAVLVPTAALRFRPTAATYEALGLSPPASAPAPRAALPADDGEGPLTAAPPSVLARSDAATIDALFGPAPRVETAGVVWTYVDQQLKPVRVRVGISDGQMSELIDGALEPGTPLVTSVVAAGASTRAPASGSGGLFMTGAGRPRGGGRAPANGG